jgi:O-antigen ligase
MGSDSIDIKSKTSGQESPELSINVLWFLYAFVFGIFQVASLAFSTRFSPFLIYPVFLSTIIFFFIKPSGKDIINARRYNRPLLYYSFFVCISVIPYVILVKTSFITFFSSVIAFFVPFAIFRPVFNNEEFQVRVKYFIKGLYYSFILCLIIILLTGKYVISPYEGKRFMSDMIGASIISRLAIFVATYAMLRVFEDIRDIPNYIVLLFAVFMLVISGSKIGIVSLVVLSLIILMIKIKKKKTYVIILVLIGLFAALNLNSRIHEKVKFFLDYKKSNAKGVSNLNGRTDIWKDVISYIDKSKYMGYGYGSPRVILTKEFNPLLRIDISQAHNAWLESMLNVGIIGTIFLLFLLLKTFRNLFLVLKRIRGEGVFVYNFILVFFIYHLIRGFTEASFAQASTIEVLIFFCFVIIVRNAVAFTKNPIALQK